MVECNGLSGPFYPVPEWLARTDLPFGAKMLFAYLLYCILTGRDVPPISEIAEQVGMTKTAAVRSLQLLRDAGFVQTERTRTAPVRLIYRLYQPASSVRPLLASETDAHRCTKCTADGVENTPSNGVQNTPSLYIYKREEVERDTPPLVPPPGGSAHDEVWQELLSVYPKRAGGLGHSEGRKVLARLLKEKADPEAILEGARRYADYIRATGREKTEFVAMIPTWLRQRRWEEDWTPPERPSNGRWQSDLGGFDVLMRMIEEEERETDGRRDDR
ncbi:MAG: winged helix-turn-helix domain-containing protein [Fimbriimonadales bacterium]